MSFVLYYFILTFRNTVEKQELFIIVLQNTHLSGTATNLIIS